VSQRYYGYYANRTRGRRRNAAGATAEGSGSEQRDAGFPLGEVKFVEPEDFSHVDAKLRWADLIRLIYEVDPLACPRCGGPRRVIALIQEPKVIDRILKHLRGRGRDARAGPWATAAGGWGEHRGGLTRRRDAARGRRSFG